MFFSDVKTQRPVSKQGARLHSDGSVEVVFKNAKLVKSKWSITRKISQLLSISISEYIRRDLQENKEGIDDTSSSGDVNTDTTYGDVMMKEISDSCTDVNTDPDLQTDSDEPNK